MKLRKGDTIMVTVGKDRGGKGKIDKVLPKLNKVLVPGINVYKRHTKPRSEKQHGGIIDIVKPLSVSNVTLLCPKCGQPTRVGYQIDKNKEKRRVCKKCGALI